MRLSRIYKHGEIMDVELYARLKKIDAKVFPGCDNEFKTNRDWWVSLDEKGKIVAYCGCSYNGGTCKFLRAWVHSSHRGKGIQRKMIKARLKAAKGQCWNAITYTTIDNPISANNLIKCGFTLCYPTNRWAGDGQIYFQRQIA